MTLQALYEGIGEDYAQALRVLRVEKLVDKHIRRLPHNGLIESMIQAGDPLDGTKLFEAAHAVKGNCGNLGLTKLAAGASEIAEEFRPGARRTMSDDAVREKLRAIDGLYRHTAAVIAQYEAESV